MPLDSMVADPTLANTATETLRALYTRGLIPVLIQELTYGPSG